MAAQTKTGQNLRWYFNGSVIGMGRMTSLKPDTTRGLDPVKQAGSDDVLEYASKIMETTLSMGYNVIHKAALAFALGQTLSSGTGGTKGLIGGVPELPDNLDCVERRLQAGTANTGKYDSGGNWVSLEVVQGYTLYQVCNWEKDSYDQEVDKIVARSLSMKCRRPRNYEGINGIVFDTFVADGRRTAFKMSQLSITEPTGQRSVRAETPLSVILTEGIDYTIAYPGDSGMNDVAFVSSGVASTISSGAAGILPGSSGTPAYQSDQSGSGKSVLNFVVPPASSTVPNVLVVYAW